MMDDKEIIKHVISKLGLPAAEKPRKFESGQTNKVYGIGNEYIVKIQSDHPDLPDRLKGQKQISEKLLEAGAKVPRIIDEDEYDGKTVLLIEKLEGQILTHLWPEMDDEQREDVVRQIAEQLKLFHSIKFESFVLMANRGNKSSSFMKAVKEAKDLRSIDRSKLGEEQLDMVEYLEDFFTNKISILDGEEQSVFVHNDIHFENIFVKHGQLIGIIDFDRWSKASRDYELNKMLDFLNSPSWYVEKDLEPKYQESLTQPIKWLKQYYPELFAADDLIDRMRLYYVETMIWLINQYLKGKCGEAKLSKKFADFYTGDWLAKMLT